MEDPLDAGDFGAWLVEVRAAIRGDAGPSMKGADVPCGDCTGCCESSQFVHIAPDEQETLTRIPAALLFPAPGLPKGHVVLGYDERGRCPMLTDAGCSIYEHRPRACRAYDCRIFAAAGLDPGDDKPAIAVRVRRWRFRVASDVDRGALAAVRAAAAAADDARNPTERALRAISEGSA